MKYLLPCSCGESLKVDTSQAGQELTCACGATLEVPTLRGIRQLEPAESTAAPASRSEKKWSAKQGALFGVGVLVAVIGLAVGGMVYLSWRQLDTGMNEEKELAFWNEKIDDLPADEMWDAWQEVKRIGLGPQQPPEYVVIRRNAQKQARFMIGAFVVAGLGLVLAASSIVIPSK